MTIESVDTYIISEKLKRTFFFSQWKYDERRICIVKIVSSCGKIGWGESYGPASVVRAGIKQLTELILGKNVQDTEYLWQLMHHRTLDYSRSGPLVSAISAIDVALWDLKGKIYEEPVYRLLGGKKRDSIVPYATGLYFTDQPELSKALCEEARHYVDQGFAAIKMKVGLSLEEDKENVKAVREAIGPKTKLMIDANHAYSLREASELALAVEPYQISWFEEPISPEYYDQYRELRNMTSIPIAAGECEYLRFGFHRLLSSRSVDIVQPDICACGGLTEAKRIATLASVHGVEIVPHTWGSGIAIAAAAHFIFNLDETPGRMKSAAAYIELDRTENALRDNLTQGGVCMKGGEITISEGPGLGIEVDLEALERYSEDHERQIASQPPTSA